MGRFVRFSLYALLAGAVVLAWLLGSGRGQRLWSEATSRSPHEVIRHLKRRLQGHDRLEAVLSPVLRLAQSHYEREPPAGPLPSLGKGQQPQALAPHVPGIVKTVSVANPQEIENALLKADAGTRILITPGLYPFQRTLRLGQDGAPDAPVVLSAAQPGTVWLEFEQDEGILVDRPHWVFENLNIRGACQRANDCEHAFHVVGRAAFTTLRNNRITDFNAHVKVNGFNDVWPDHGTMAFNTLTNQGPRETDRPVTPFDLVGASHWRVHDNLLTQFVKLDGNQISFGMFMKGGSEDGRFERNLVICSLSGISMPGIRVGISFGGGGTHASACRRGRCEAFEHRGGLAANNIVAHCNDTGLDVNRSREIRLAHNTLVNTSGIGVRNAPADAHLYANLYEGVALSREGARLTTSGDLPGPTHRYFANADGLLFEWMQIPDPIPSESFVTNDFSGSPRRAKTLPGAVEQLQAGGAGNATR